MMDILTLPALAEVHSSDIALLLLVSCLFELTFQAITFKITLKSEQEKELSRFLLNLKYQCAESKLRGPVAFVETSKLERSILAREKEISENNSSRDLQLQKVKLVSSRLNYVLYAIVAAFYWGVPMIILNDVETKGDAYFKQGKADLARDAYQAALDVEGQSNNGALQMKLNDLAQLSSIAK